MGDFGQPDGGLLHRELLADGALPDGGPVGQPRARSERAPSARNGGRRDMSVCPGVRSRRTRTGACTLLELLRSRSLLLAGSCNPPRPAPPLLVGGCCSCVRVGGLF